MAARIAPPDPQDVVIRYATTDVEACAIHRFLLMVAKPMMRCAVDPVRSLSEIFRVCAQEAAIMAVIGDNMVGTMGIIKVDWWYGFPDQCDFLTERWQFVLPQFHNTLVDQRLAAEADAIADAAGLEFINMGKPRERKGKLFMLPRVYTPERREDVLREQSN